MAGARSSPAGRDPRSPSSPGIGNSQTEADGRSRSAEQDPSGAGRSGKGSTGKLRTLSVTSKLGLLLTAGQAGSDTSYCFSSVAKIQVEENLIPERRSRDGESSPGPGLRGKVYDYFVQSVSESVSRRRSLPFVPAGTSQRRGERGREEPQSPGNTRGENAALGIPDHNPALGIPDHNPALGIPDHNLALGILDHNPALGIPDHNQALGIPDHNPALGIPNPNTASGTPDPNTSTAPNAASGIPDPNPALETLDPNPALGIPDPNPALGTPDPNTSMAPNPALGIPDPNTSTAPNPALGIPDPNPALGTPDPNTSTAPNPALETLDPNPALEIPDPNPALGIPDPNTSTAPREDTPGTSPPPPGQAPPASPSPSQAPTPGPVHLGNCGELLRWAKARRLRAPQEAALRVMSQHLLQVLRSPALYGRLNAAERDLLPALRSRGRPRLVVADIPPAEPGGRRGRLCYYDEDGDCWRQLCQLPAEVSGRGCALCPMFNYLFLAPGWEGEGRARSPSRRLLCYDPLAGAWSHLCPLRQARPRCRLVALDGHLYAIGGECLATVERYDPRRDRWAFAAPLPGDAFAVAHAAAACGGEIYVAGGTLRPLLLRYDPRRDSWATSPALGHQDGTAELVGAHGFLYRFQLRRGGAGGGAEVTVWRCSASAGLWYRCDGRPLPPEPAGLGCAALGGLVHCLGRGFHLRFLADPESPRFGAKELRPFPEPHGSLLPAVLVLPEEGAEAARR